MFRGYVPGLITSILLLPYTYFGLQNIYNTFSISEIVLYGILGVVFMVLNLWFAHWIGIKTKQSLVKQFSPRPRFTFNTIGFLTSDNKTIVDFYTKAFGFTTTWDGIQPNHKSIAMPKTSMVHQK